MKQEKQEKLTFLKSDNNRFEKCVVCNKITDVDKRTHIDLRFEYVEGCGQLCKECYKEQMP